MRLLITIASYAAFMLLILPVRISEILYLLPVGILGAGLVLWKKPYRMRVRLSKEIFFSAAFFAAFLGLRFYELWLPSSKVRAIAALLHISSPVFLALVAICAGAVATFFIAGLLQQGKLLVQAQAEKKRFLVSVALCLIAAVFTVCMTQKMVDASYFLMGWFNLACNILFVYALILLVYCLTGGVRSAVFSVTGVFMVMSVTNAYVYKFRDRLFEPVDFLSIGTAMNVADNYSLLPVPILVVTCLCGWAGMCIWLFAAAEKKKCSLSCKKRVILAVCSLVGAASVLVYAANLKTQHWQKYGAQDNGYILNFVAGLKELRVAKPKDYDLTQIEALSRQYAQDTGEPEKKPHIIAIMDESFTDYSVVGELHTNQAVTPFISSLKEDAISGYALASVYGGNTANSEFEFLTGNSMAWMTQNTVPYQQYIRSSTYSMVSYLKENYQYRCIAMHPFEASGWNRPDTYENLGFDQMLFQEDFPQEQYIRKYISDREMFETIVDTYEKQKAEPLFLFGVTMQNHGAYNYAGEDFTPSISLTGYDAEHPQAEQYLSLLHETDKAVEYLISYFKQVDEDVIIVFFGDHQPKLDDEFYAALNKNAGNTLEDIQKRYTVPFFVWANYDVEEQEVACTSLNYLSNYVYEMAGIPLPTYNRFLSEMEAYIPAINANGFYSAAAQKHLTFEEASEEEQNWLSLYEKLQYNCLFDEKNKNKTFFPLLIP